MQRNSISVFKNWLLQGSNDLAVFKMDVSLNYINLKSKWNKNIV